jgi:hypothetical protein
VESPSKFAVSLPEETNGGFVLTKIAVRMTGTGRVPTHNPQRAATWRFRTAVGQNPQEQSFRFPCW